MNININSNIDVFYMQLLELLSNFAPLNTLREREKEVLAEIMRQHYIHKDSVKRDYLRRNLVFSHKNKQVMAQNLNMEMGTFYANLSILRKKGILGKDNMLINVLNIFPNDTFELKVTFNIQDND